MREHDNLNSIRKDGFDIRPPERFVAAPGDKSFGATIRGSVTDLRSPNICLMRLRPVHVT
jgi:hypothetical protein